MNILTKRKKKVAKKKEKIITAKTKYLSVHRCALKYFVFAKEENECYFL
jgi:hypothetical protein